MSVLTKMANYWREHGALSMVSRARQAIWHTERYVIVRKRVDDKPVDAQCAGFVFRAVDVSDVAWIAQQWPDHLSYVGPDVEAVLIRRMEAGEIGVIGVPSGSPHELACMIWLGFRDFAMLSVCGPEPTPEWACAKNLWTAPHHRRKGLARGVQKHMEALGARQGCHEVWAFVKPHNTISRSHFGQLEYEECGKACFLQRWGRMSVRVTLAGRSERRAACLPETAVL